MLPMQSLPSYANLDDSVCAATSTHKIQRHSLTSNPMSAVTNGHPSCQALGLA